MIKTIPQTSLLWMMMSLASFENPKGTHICVPYIVPMLCFGTDREAGASRLSAFPRRAWEREETRDNSGETSANDSGNITVFNENASVCLEFLKNFLSLKLRQTI